MKKIDKCTHFYFICCFLGSFFGVVSDEITIQATEIEVMLHLTVRCTDEVKSLRGKATKIYESFTKYFEFLFITPQFCKWNPKIEMNYIFPTIDETKECLKMSAFGGSKKISYGIFPEKMFAIQ